MRRAMVIITAVGLLLGLGAAPAVAVMQSNESVIGAEADWSLAQGDTATSVHLRVADNRLKEDGASSERTVGVNVQIYRESTDSETGISVTEFLTTDPFYAPASAFDIHQLKEASVTATVTLTGTRSTGTEETAVGPLEILVVADWTANGPMTREMQRTWSTEFGGWTSVRYALSSVPAIGTASITGDLDLGSLGSADGQLVVLRDRAMSHESADAPGASTPSVTGSSDAASFGSHVLRAVAGWTLDDVYGSELWLTIEQPFSGSDRDGQAMASAELNQGYCDATADESVMRMLTAEPTALTSGGVSQSMAGATATMTLTFTGTESRQPGCSEPGDGDEIVNEVSFTVAIEATWTATGDLEFSRVQRTTRSDDEFLHARSAARGRQASAVGRVSGDVVSGPLVTVINSYLEDRHDWSTGDQSG